MLATETRPTHKSGTGEKWKVIVLNDSHNTFDSVAGAISKHIPGISYDEGLAIASRIHYDGSEIVWSGPLEPAEMYLELLESEGLTMAPLEN